MRADRLMPWLWLIVAFAYALRIVAELASGQGALADTVPMLTALAKRYEEDE